jgi:hypothetical protein
MADLIDKFFKEDLTEAERTALGKQLSISDEAAQRFGEKAEEAYRALGLPEPQWTGPDILRHPSRLDSTIWIWVGLIMVTLLGGLGWWFVALKNQESLQPLAQTGSALSTTPLPAKPAKVQKKNPVASTSQTMPTNQAIASKAQPAKQAVASVPATLSLAPKFTPVNVDQNPNFTFSTLSISLRLTTPRSLSVQVLNAKGAVLLPLFSGTLPTGNWAFQWNGLLSDGRLAPPGRYRIKVQSGSWSQTKDILIQK